MFWKKKKSEENVTEKREPSFANRHVHSDELFDTSVEFDQARIDYIEQNAIQRKAPTPKGVNGAAMDSCDAASMAYQSDFSTVSPVVLSYYVASSSFIGYHAMAIMGQHWLIRKGLSMKPKDAAKKWFKIGATGGKAITPEDKALIESYDVKYKLKRNCVQGCVFRNMFGIRHIIFKHTDPNFDYSKPFNPADFADGRYAGMSQVDPYWVYPEFINDDLSDPSRIGFYDPTYWIINSKKYHKSHLVVLMGDELPDYLKPTYRYGGISLTQKVYERIYAAERVANETPQLVQTKRLNVLKTSLETAKANMPKFVSRLKAMVSFRDNYGVRVVGTNEEVQQLDTSLTDLDQVTMTQYHLVCAELGVPASKLLGTGHAGFGTGETDDDYYIEEVEELQHSDMTEIVEAHYARLKPSVLDSKIGDVDLCPEWEPIKVMSELDIADVNNKNANTAALWFNMGAIDNIDAREHLASSEISMFSGISMPEVVDELDEDEDAPID